jgi:hypothetical protein
MGGEQSHPLDRNDGDFAEAGTDNNILAGEPTPTNHLDKTLGFGESRSEHQTSCTGQEQLY